MELQKLALEIGAMAYYEHDQHEEKGYGVVDCFRYWQSNIRKLLFVSFKDSFTPLTEANPVPTLHNFSRRVCDVV